MTVPLVQTAGAAASTADPAASDSVAPPGALVPAPGPPSVPPLHDAVVGGGGGRAGATQSAGGVRAIFDAHYEFVWRSLRRLGVAEADVDDVVQEVFVVVHRKLPEFAARSKVTTWLYGICYRVASEHQRRPHVRREQPTAELPEQVDEGASPEERYAGREARARLDEVLAHLDTEKRAVFVMYELDELPVEQIAEIVGVPAGTVYSRLKVARQEFERAIGRLRARWAHDASRRRS